MIPGFKDVFEVRFAFPFEPQLVRPRYGKIQIPATGWIAFLVEQIYPSGGPAPFKFTTSVRVLPDTLPFRFEPKGRPN